MIKNILIAFFIFKKKLTKLFETKSARYGFLIYCLIIYYVISTYKYSLKGDIKFTYTSDSKSKIFEPTSLEDHQYIVARYFGPRKYWLTSNLGKILFKNEKYTSFTTKNRTFLILVWKDWQWMKERHVYYFGAKKSDKEILEGCSVTNCQFTGNSKSMPSADAVLVHIMQGLIPKVYIRNKTQIWVFLNDESPINVFLSAKKKPKLRTWANIFNWSMSYRTDSEVPVPYGRTVPLEKPVYYNVTQQTIAALIPHLKQKQSDVLVTIVMSHCNVAFRMSFLKELQKYIKIDIYGRCAKDVKKRHGCPGHFKNECPLMNKYYFYLVLENSMCSQYLTEKIFHNAYSKGAIPILVGPSLHDSKMLLPPHSYIHYDNHLSPKDLATKINNSFLNINDYLSYHLWRNHFQVLNEHGFFRSKSYHLCRLCEALNYNEEQDKIYDLDELRLFLDPKLLCRNKLFIIND